MNRTLLLLAAHLALLGTSFAILGGWLVLVLRRIAPSVSRPPSALVGVVLAQVVGWYCSAAGVGLDRMWLVLLVASAVLGLVALGGEVADLRSAARAATWRATHGAAADAFAAILGGGLVVVASRMLALGTLSVISPNNDVAYYAAAARHIRSAGFAAGGPVVGVHLGKIAKTDVYGEFNLLAFAEWITGQSGSHVAMVTMVLSCALLSQVGCKFLRSVSDLPPLLCALVAALPVSTFFFTYVVANFFGSQVLGMVFATVAAGQVATYHRLEHPRDRLASLIVLAIALAGLDLTYPHMLFLLVPVVVGGALLAARLNVRESARILVGVAAAFLITAAVLPERTIGGFHRLLFLGNFNAGWPQGGVLPSGLIGFGPAPGRSEYQQVTLVASVVVSIALIAVAVAASVRLYHRSHATWPASLLALGAMIGVSYVFMYLSRDETSYRHWKWISFFQPLAVMSLIAPTIGWLTQLGRTRVAAWLGPTTAASILIAIVVANGRASTDYGSEVFIRSGAVPLELARLGKNPRLSDVPAVNVALSPYWESMWAVVSLYPRTVYLESPTYYFTDPAPGTAFAPWTLVRRDEPLARPIAEERVLGARYRLVRYGG